MNDNAPAAEAEKPVFHMEKLYLKDLSFESPNAPEVFRENLEPQVEFNLSTASSQKGPDHYESTLSVSAKVHSKDRVLFMVEITYAGLFLLKNLPQEHMGPTLGIECPHILFPFVRRIVSDMVVEGGFKPLLLDPINFAVLYQQARAKEQQAAAGGEKPVLQ